MPAKPVYTVIGGDKRLYYLAQELLKENSVFCFATDGTPDGAKCVSSLREAVRDGDILIFPVPFTRDGETVSARCPIPAEEVLELLLPKHRAFFGGKLPERVKSRCRELGIPALDWMEMESVAMPNAVLTAEGAILEALHTPDGLYRTKAAVLGYGRCGKALAARLKNLCAQTTVFARSSLQRDEARAQCIPAEPLGALPDMLGQYGLLFNTVPSMVLGAEACSRFAPGAVVLDLASGAPEGHMDIAALQSAGARAVSCPGLPGKYFPREAGRILARAVLAE